MKPIEQKRVGGRFAPMHGKSAKAKDGSLGVYEVWRAMRRRCLNPNDKGYYLYGARGISICERWSSFTAFEADMGERPPNTSIDRINNNGNYEPGNCRWATPAQQQTNTRRNRLLTLEGRTMNYAEWAQELGVRRGQIRRWAVAGWTTEMMVAEAARRAKR
jgi:hypothetical protein